VGLPGVRQGRIGLHEISTGIARDLPLQVGVHCFARAGQNHPKFSGTELLFAGMLEQQIMQFVQILMIVADPNVPHDFSRQDPFTR